MTQRRLVRAGHLAVCLMLCACAPATADAAVEQEIVRLDTARHAPAVLVGGAGPKTLRVPFELPVGARQGPDSWYLVRLRYRVRFARDSGRGFAWVTSTTNDRTAAQIEYTTDRRRGRLSVRRTTVDLEHGQRERSSRSARDSLTFTNYLQYQGIRPGKNMWTIDLEQAGSARVERLEVLGDSAIVQTSRNPFPLTLTAAADRERPQIGERFTIKTVLTARPGQPVRDIVVRALPPEGGGVEILGPAKRRIGRQDDRRRTVTFTARARLPGTHAITVVADSDANRPNANVQVEVRQATRATSAPATAWVLTLVPALTMAAWLVVSRRRQRHLPL